MVIIRAETVQDYGAVCAVHRAAFGREEEALLVEQLRRRPEFIPGLSLVAEVDGIVVGHVLFSPIEVQTEGAKIAALALAPMAVLPGYQNRGVGTALVREGLAVCQRLGHRVVIVVGHPLYYPRFGFTPARELGLVAPFPVPDEAFLVCQLGPQAGAELGGTVRYPPPFEGV